MTEIALFVIAAVLLWVALDLTILTRNDGGWIDQLRWWWHRRKAPPPPPPTPPVYLPEGISREQEARYRIDGTLHAREMEKKRLEQAIERDMDYRQEILRTAERAEREGR